MEVGISLVIRHARHSSNTAPNSGLSHHVIADFIHQPRMKSEKTFAYQATLPSLPIPPLFETAQKYLRSVRPLLNDEEYANTQVGHFNIHPSSLHLFAVLLFTLRLVSVRTVVDKATLTTLIVVGCAIGIFHAQVFGKRGEKHHQSIFFYFEFSTCLSFLAYSDSMKNVVAEFVRPGGIAHELHRRLEKHREEKHKKGKSWIEDWWLEYGYLRGRYPLPINLSCHLLFHDWATHPGGISQTQQAARWIPRMYPVYIQDSELRLTI